MSDSYERYLHYDLWGEVSLEERRNSFEKPKFLERNPSVEVTLFNSNHLQFSDWKPRKRRNLEWWLFSLFSMGFDFEKITRITCFSFKPDIFESQKSSPEPHISQKSRPCQKPFSSISRWFSHAQQLWWVFYKRKDFKHSAFHHQPISYDVDSSVWK